MSPEPCASHDDSSDMRSVGAARYGHRSSARGSFALEKSWQDATIQTLEYSRTEGAHERSDP